MKLYTVTISRSISASKDVMRVEEGFVFWKGKLDDPYLALLLHISLYSENTMLSSQIRDGYVLYAANSPVVLRKDLGNTKGVNIHIKFQFKSTLPNKKPLLKGGESDLNHSAIYFLAEGSLMKIIINAKTYIFFVKDGALCITKDNLPFYPPLRKVYSWRSFFPWLKAKKKSEPKRPRHIRVMDV